MRIKSFTETPEDIVTYGPLEDDRGVPYILNLKGWAKGALLVQIKGIRDRDAAEALKGEKLTVSRDALPKSQDGEYYHADLIGIRVYHVDGRELGVVTEVHNFGAGDLIDVRLLGTSKTVLLPFNESTVSEVDLDKKKLLVDPIAGLLD